MTQQLREAVAQAPDGIAMMGHPGNEAIMPLAAEAADAGIIMMYQNVDVDQVRARYGGGYVGAQLHSQGRALGEEALRQFGFSEGDKAIVLANLAQRERALRELGTWEALEEAGMEIIHVDSGPTWAADPNLGIPSMVAAITDNPDVKMVVFSGGQTLGNTQTYFEAAGLEAGQVKAHRLRYQRVHHAGFRRRLDPPDRRSTALPARLPARAQHLPDRQVRPGAAER